MLQLNKKRYSKIEIGKKGEKVAIKYLKKKGNKIIKKNYWTSFGETDIIAENETFIVFIEVKTRRLTSNIPPSANVTFEKQQKLLKSGFQYIKINNIEKQPRFDVIEVLLTANSLKVESINHLKNAFIQNNGYSAL